jgi:hypothetical protein
MQALGLTPYLIYKSRSTFGSRVIDARFFQIEGTMTIYHIAREKLHPAVAEQGLSSESMSIATLDTISIPIADAASTLLTWFGLANERVLEAPEPEALEWSISTSQLYIAAQQYFMLIMGLRHIRSTNLNDLIVQKEKLRILKRGLENSKDDIYDGVGTHALWLWRAFCALLGSVILEIQIWEYAPELLPDPALDDLQSQFAGFVSSWVRETGITKWQDARLVLIACLWPDVSFANESLAQRTWVEAVTDKGRSRTPPRGK